MGASICFTRSVVSNPATHPFVFSTLPTNPLRRVSCLLSGQTNFPSPYSSKQYNGANTRTTQTQRQIHQGAECEAWKASAGTEEEAGIQKPCQPGVSWCPRIRRLRWPDIRIA